MASAVIPSDLMKKVSGGKLTPEIESLLGEWAVKAKQHSYSPYSKFRVGAALLASNGNIWTGCNVENASYGGAICAERTAFVKAVSHSEPRPFLAIAVCTDVDTFISPCGFCRQFMVEFGKELQVYLFKSDGKAFKKWILKELIPDSFGPADLERPRETETGGASQKRKLDN
ncbi:hypothetical protein HDV05_000088 [Chytridiales sp. JEL 0842]|nr:hypothetical protein HDV05_000088 [Chytridiales sp. JEL 0842]